MGFVFLVFCEQFFSILNQTPKHEWKPVKTGEASHQIFNQIYFILPKVKEGERKLITV